MWKNFFKNFDLNKLELKKIFDEYFITLDPDEFQLFLFKEIILILKENNFTKIDLMSLLEFNIYNEYFEIYFNVYIKNTIFEKNILIFCKYCSEWVTIMSHYLHAYFIQKLDN